MRQDADVSSFFFCRSPDSAPYLSRLCLSQTWFQFLSPPYSASVFAQKAAGGKVLWCYSSRFHVKK